MVLRLLTCEKKETIFKVDIEKFDIIDNVLSNVKHSSEGNIDISRANRCKCCNSDIFLTKSI